MRATRPAGGDGEAVPDFITQWVRWGAGPRAGQSLLLAGKARAVLHGRPAVSLDDVRAVAPPVLRHRILVNFQAEADGIDAEQVVSRLLDAVPRDGNVMSRPHVVTSSELQSLRDLELVTKATVEGLRQGLHRSPFHGYSAEFSQYRHYRPGDDLKYVDWKAFARTDRIYTRQFRETTNLSALFVVDVSRSMDFPTGNGSREPGTGDRSSSWRERWPRSSARSCSIRAMRPACWRVDDARISCRRAAAIITCACSWRSSRRSARAAPSSIAEALRRAATIVKRRGLVIVVSDLYEDEAAIGQLRRLARMGHDVIVVHTLSREELTLDVGGAAEFVDLESGRKLMVQPSAARDAYVAAFDRWLATSSSSFAATASTTCG